MSDLKLNPYKSYSFQFEVCEKFGWRCAYTNIDFLGLVFTLYFVPLSSSRESLKHLDDMFNYLSDKNCHFSLSVGDSRYPIAIKLEVLL